MMKRQLSILLLLGLVLGSMIPAFAQEEVTYRGSPDNVAIFLNNIAFVQDSITLPGTATPRIILPQQIFQDTLIVRENGRRVPRYTIRHIDSGVLLHWNAQSDAALREITVTYLIPGISWKPTYDMVLQDAEGTVFMDFFAEVQNQTLSLSDAAVSLVAGYVDTTQQVDTVTNVTANQAIVGYDEASGGGLATGGVILQHIYQVRDSLVMEPGDTVYTSLLSAELPARRVHVWNAGANQQVTVIYKVRNDSDLPLAPGIVRSYRDGLFSGSDFIELTPVGSEGSVTTGNLPDVRVNRTESRSAFESFTNRLDTQHEVTLTISNFGTEAVSLDVVDTWIYDAEDFSFSDEPQREPNNILRWQITVEGGETKTITYYFKT